MTSLFLALSKDAVINSNKDLKLLVKDSQTPKGLNEQGLKEMTKKDVYKSVINSDKDLKLLVKDSQTPKGLNEQGLKEMIKKNVYKSVTSSLNSIYKRLDK